MKNPETIGRLERVALREVWKHEAHDFTRWLEDNIDVLNEALRLNLQNIERERAAGAFSVDLVAEDDNGAKIIIENQLEKSNHDHLGKVLTYLAAMKARGAIWIVAEPRPEHVAAVAWLNDSSSADFYLVKVEAVRIGVSPAAPLLTLIVGPSAETEAVAKSNEEFVERHHLRKRWWTGIVARPEARLHKSITPGVATWMSAGSGVSGLTFNYLLTQDHNGVELYIDRGNATENKSIFDQLVARRDEIERVFKGQLMWNRQDDKRACRIRAEFDGGYRSPLDEWDQSQSRAVDAMCRLEEALRPHVKSLKLGQGELSGP
jgi:hypothetical protein